MLAQREHAAKKQRIATRINNQTFRVAGITAYLLNDGTVEEAARMANTTRTHDRRDDRVVLGKVEKVDSKSVDRAFGIALLAVPDITRLKIRQAFDFRVVIPTGIEPVTYRLGICRSILLSYGTTRLHT